MRILTWLPSGTWTVLAALATLLAVGVLTLETDAVIASLTEQGTQAIHRSANRVVMARLIQQRLLEVERRTRWLLAFSEPDLLSVNERAAYDKARALLRDALDELRAAIDDSDAREMHLVVDQLSEQERLIHEQAQSMLSGTARLSLDDAFAGLQSLGQRLAAVASSSLERDIGGLKLASERQRGHLKELAALLGLISVLILGVSWRLQRKTISVMTRQLREQSDGPLHEPARLTTAPDLRELATEVMRLGQRHIDQHRADWRLITNLVNVLKRPAVAIGDSAGQLASETTGELNGAQASLVTQAVAASDALRNTLDEFARYVTALNDSDSAQAVTTNVDMRALVEGVIAGYRAAEEQRSVRLNASLEAVTVVGDAQRLRAMVDRLVSNAVKFSPDGGEINIILRAVGTQLKLEIEDDGPGIDDAERPHVFEPFFVGKAAQGFNAYAPGLGLATVQECVSFHRGQIEIADPRHPKRGARLRVQLPLEAYASAHR